MSEEDIDCVTLGSRIRILFFPDGIGLPYRDVIVQALERDEDDNLIAIFFYLPGEVCRCSSVRQKKTRWCFRYHDRYPKLEVVDLELVDPLTEP